MYMELLTGIALHCIGSMFCCWVFCHCLGIKVKVPWWVHCWWPPQGTIYMLGNWFLSHRPLAERILSWICHKLDILLFYRPFSGSGLLPYANRAWFRYLFSPSNNRRKSISSMRDLTACPNLAKCLLRGLTPTASKWTLHTSWFPRRGGNLNGPSGSTSPGWKGGAQPLPYFSLKEVVNPAGVSTNLAGLCFDTGEGYNRFDTLQVSIRLSWLNVLKASQEKKGVSYKVKLLNCEEC